MAFFKSSKKTNTKLTPQQMLMNECSILFCSRKDLQVFQKGTFCGFSCKDGWISIIETLCYRLEALNIQYYPKYKVRIQVEQIKEKFGTLRFYYRVIADDTSLLGYLRNAIYRSYNWINDNVDFKFKEVYDSPKHIRYEVKQQNVNEFNDNIERWGDCSNVSFEDIPSGKFMITENDVYRGIHNVPTKHKVIHWMNELMWKAHCGLSACNESMSSEKMIIIKKLDADAHDLVRKAEDDCMNVCEDCGHQIGDDWSPRCQIRGWIRYVCQSCAEKSGRQYYKNGALWKGSECLKTKEQVDEEAKVDESGNT